MFIGVAIRCGSYVTNCKLYRKLIRITDCAKCGHHQVLWGGDSGHRCTYINTNGYTMVKDDAEGGVFSQ